MIYTFYNFKTRGIGLISKTRIPKDTCIGNYLSKNIQLTPQSRFIYNGWIETNPLGRYLNHNPNSNLILVKGDGVIEAHAKMDIDANVELTVNYMDIIKIIDLPKDLVEKYKIFDYDYVEEKILLNSNLI